MVNVVLFLLLNWLDALSLAHHHMVGRRISQSDPKSASPLSSFRVNAKIVANCCWAEHFCVVHNFVFVCDFLQMGLPCAITWTIHWIVTVVNVVMILNENATTIVRLSVYIVAARCIIMRAAYCWLLAALNRIVWMSAMIASTISANISISMAYDAVLIATLFSFFCFLSLYLSYHCGIWRSSRSRTIDNRTRATPIADRSKIYAIKLESE